MTKEYIVWGKSPKNPDHEEPLYTRSESWEEAQRVVTFLENSHGCHSMRIQVLDLAKPLGWEARIHEALGQ